MGREINRLIATCRTIEAYRIGAAAVLMRHAGSAIPYAFAPDDMMLSAEAIEILLSDADIRSEGTLATNPVSGKPAPTISARLEAETMALDQREARILVDVLGVELRVAHLAGKIALMTMPELDRSEVPEGFLEHDEDGPYTAEVNREARALLRRIRSPAPGPGGAEIILMGRRAGTPKGECGDA